MTRPDFGFKKPKRYKKLVKHKRRPNKETRAFSRNSYEVVQTEPKGSVIVRNKLNGKMTRYTKTGKKASNQKM